MEKRLYCVAPLVVVTGSCVLLAIAACNTPVARNTDSPTDMPGSTSAVMPPTAASTSWMAAAITSALDTPTSASLVHPTPAPTGPITVALTLAEAESVVASWFIAENEAAIERSFYLTTEDACAAWAGSRESGELSEGIGSVDWCADASVRSRTRSGAGAATLDRYEVIADAYVVVEAAFGGVDLDHPAIETPTGLDLCYPVSSATRVHFIALFDATTAQYLGYRSLGGPTNDDWSRWYRAVAAHDDDGLDRFLLAPRAPGTRSPIDATVLAAAATTTASAAKHPSTPEATMTLPGGDEPALTLDVGEVPAALVPVARVVPLVPGAWWRYRVTEVENGVHWWRTTLTETIATGTRLAPDVMAVRLRSDTAPGGPAWLEPWNDFTSVRLLVHDGVLQPTSDALPDTSPDRWRSLSPDEGAPQYMLRLPLRAGEQYNFWWGTERVSGASVPAGEFRDCTVMTEMWGNDLPYAHWLCPGIGYVRHEASGCGSFSGWWTVYELEAHFVPDMTVVR